MPKLRTSVCDKILDDPECDYHPQETAAPIQIPFRSDTQLSISRMPPSSDRAEQFKKIMNQIFPNLTAEDILQIFFQDLEKYRPYIFAVQPFCIIGGMIVRLRDHDPAKVRCFRLTKKKHTRTPQ